MGTETELIGDIYESMPGLRKGFSCNARVGVPEGQQVVLLLYALRTGRRRRRDGQG